MAEQPSRGVALVTGAARRIGRTLAIEAAKAGYDIAVHHRASPVDAEETVALCWTMGVKARAFQIDLSHHGAADKLIDMVKADLGPVTLTVNSASLFEDDRLTALSEQVWDAMMITNLRAPVMLAQAMARALPDDLQGLAINVLDQRVLKPNPQFFSYGVSKAALWQATVIMAQALAPRVRVNAIAPGPTLKSIHQTADEFAAEGQAALLGRNVDPEEIAGALSYLIDARAVTGQLLCVDAGQHLAWKTPDIIGD